MKISLKDLALKLKARKEIALLAEKLNKFFDELYIFFYYIGAVIIRKSRNYKRRYKKMSQRLYWFLKRKVMDFYDFIGDIFSRAMENIAQPFRESATAIKSVAEEISGEKLEKKPLSKILWKYKKEVLGSVSSFKKPLKKILNYALPLMAMFIFTFTVLYIRNINFSVAVSYNGKEIGCIEDESVFNDAEKEVMSRLAYEKDKAHKSNSAVFRIVPCKKEDVLRADEVSNEIIKSSGGNIKSADGLYIDGDFVGATDNGTALLMLLDSIKSSYETDSPSQTVEFANKIELKEGLYPSSAISSLGSIKNKLDGTAKKAKVYTIKPGDTPSEVAERHGISTSELVDNNEDVSKTFRPGQQLTISAAVDRLTVQVSEEITYEEDIPFGTDKSESNKYYQGVRKVTRAGVPGKERVKAKVTYINGVEETRTILSREVVSEPVNQQVVVGTKIPLYTGGASSSGTNRNFIWPVAGGRISCGFWGYYGHTGMDIAARVGTPVYASASGTVTYAGWKNGGYGNLVTINHGGGVATQYLHNSSVVVSPGQYVSQGQLIAYVGNTGNSYGSHCHFEIRLNGTPVNPANYIGTRCPY